MEELYPQALFDAIELWFLPKYGWEPHDMGSNDSKILKGAAVKDATKATVFTTTGRTGPAS